MKRGSVGGGEVTISVLGKVIKMASQRENERELTIYNRANAIFTKINFQFSSL